MSRLLQVGLVFVLFVAVGCSHPNPADRLAGMPSGTGFILKESNGKAGKHKYSVFIPRTYKADGTKWPTIVFLHGVGESGSDGIGCTTVGIGPAIADRNGSFPFIVVFPQTGFDWTSTDSENIMLDALADAQKSYNIDPDRISLSGMSSGGRGAWVLGARHPEIFSALVPMGGYSATGEVPRLTKIPIWALHNSDDWVVGVGNTQEMIRLLEAAGGHPKYTIYENSGNGHNCWDQAYNEGQLFTWLQNTRKGGAAPPK
jgi:predicted peptidase